MEEPALDDEAQRLEVQLLDGVQYTGRNAEQRVAQQEERYDLERRLAALTVRRKARQHTCVFAVHDETDHCIHPDHPRDVDYMNALLDALALDRTYPQVDDEERAAYGTTVARDLPHHGGRAPKVAKSWNGGRT